MSDAEAALDRADMERLAAGEERALDSLMARHGGRLHGYLRRLLQNPWDAEDLAQETFVRVYEHRRRFVLGQPFVAWLYTIATNLVRDRYRWRQRHPETSLPDGTDALTPGSAPECSDPSGGAEPLERVLARERAGAVRDAVAALPEELRIPLVLSEYEDRSHQEISAILACTPKAVEMRLYRARSLLRTQLGRWLETGPA